MKKLSDELVREKVASLREWRFEKDSLRKDFSFQDFTEAFCFLQRVALVSEKLDHHAEIWNVYNKVLLVISTHTAQGVTEKDFRWIELLEKA